MDIFIEQLVKKRRTGADYLKIAACVLGMIVALLLMFLGLPIQGLGFVIFAVCCGLIYLFYRLITGTKLEYEYCFTNGALDVDKIINVRSRKRLTEVNARRIELMASRKNREYQRFLADNGTKKIFACTHPDDPDVYFVVYQDEDSRRMLIFNPNEKIREGFRRYNPQKVNLND